MKPEIAEARKGHITASEIGAIAGNGHFSKRADIMRRKVREAHGLPDEFSGNVATQWGVAHEMDALEEAAFAEGWTLDVEQRFLPRTIMRGDVEIKIGATPDAYMGAEIVEVKCPYSLRNELPSSEAYLVDRPEYADQMQWQMLVADAQACHFVVWTTMGYSTHKVEPDFARQEFLIKLAAEFQAEFLEIMADEAKQAPFLADKKTASGLVRDDAEYTALAVAYIAAQEALKAAEMHHDACRSALLEACPEPCSGAGLSVSRAERKGSVNYKKIPELKGVDLDAYRGESTVVWSIKADR